MVSTLQTAMLQQEPHSQWNNTGLPHIWNCASLPFSFRSAKKAGVIIAYGISYLITWQSIIWFQANWKRSQDSRACRFASIFCKERVKEKDKLSLVLMTDRGAWPGNRNLQEAALHSSQNWYPVTSTKTRLNKKFRWDYQKYFFLVWSITRFNQTLEKLFCDNGRVW